MLTTTIVIYKNQLPAKPVFIEQKRIVRKLFYVIVWFTSLEGRILKILVMISLNRILLQTSCFKSDATALCVGFKVLLFNLTFDIESNYTSVFLTRLNNN